MVFGLLLLAASTQLLLIDEVYKIPPREWRFAELQLRQIPCTLECKYRVNAGPVVRLEFVTREELVKLQAQAPHHFLAESDYAARGALQFVVREPGEYALLVISPANSTLESNVQLEATVDFSGPAVRTLTSGRRLTIVALSLLFLAGVLLTGGTALLRAMRPANATSPRDGPISPS